MAGEKMDKSEEGSINKRRFNGIEEVLTKDASTGNLFHGLRSQCQNFFYFFNAIRIVY